jgi:hypothetical protein
MSHVLRGGGSVEVGNKTLNEALGKIFNKLADEQQKLKAIRDKIIDFNENEVWPFEERKEITRVEVYEWLEVLGDE